MSDNQTPELKPNGKPYLFDNPKNVKRVIRGLLVLCVILIGLDAVVHRHSVHPWEHVFAFYPMYGFASCVILVLAAKELRKLVMRSEDFYDPYPETKGHHEGSNSENSDA